MPVTGHPPPPLLARIFVVAIWYTVSLKFPNSYGDLNPINQSPWGANRRVEEDPLNADFSILGTQRQINRFTAQSIGWMATLRFCFPARAQVNYKLSDKEI